MQMTWRNIYIYISQDDNDLNNFFPSVSSFHSRYIKGYHVSFSLTNVTQLPPLDCLVARNWMLRLDSAFDNRIDRGYFGESCIAHRRKIYKSRISLKRIKVRDSCVTNDSLDSLERVLRFLLSFFFFSLPQFTVRCFITRRTERAK